MFCDFSPALLLQALAPGSREVRCVAGGEYLLLVFHQRQSEPYFVLCLVGANSKGVY